MQRTDSQVVSRFGDLVPGSAARFVFAICIALAAVASMKLPFLSLILLFDLLALLAWGSDLNSILRVARYTIWFFIFVFVLHLFSGGGKPFFRLWFLTATYPGATAGLLYGLKLFVFAYAGYLIFVTVDPFELISPVERLAKALGRFGRPLEAFAIAFFLAMRFLPDLSEQGLLTLLAFKTKGLDLAGSIGHKAKVVSLVIAPLFVNGFKRAEVAASALNVKGYATRHIRAIFGPPRVNLGGIVTVVVSLIILLAGWQLG